MEEKEQQDMHKYMIPFEFSSDERAEILKLKIINVQNRLPYKDRKCVYCPFRGDNLNREVL